jgi:hypothetical protein
MFKTIKMVILTFVGSTITLFAATAAAAHVNNTTINLVTDAEGWGELHWSN